MGKRKVDADEAKRIGATLGIDWGKIDPGQMVPGLAPVRQVLAVVVEQVVALLPQTRPREPDSLARVQRGPGGVRADQRRAA